MNLSWINDFAAEITKIDKARRDKTVALPTKQVLPLDFLATLQTFEESGRKEFQNLREILKKGLLRYWESVDPWNDIANKDGKDFLANLKGGLLRVLTGKRKEGNVYMRYVARDFLNWISNYGDPFEMLWAERLAFLFFEAHGNGDIARRQYVAILFGAVKVANRIYKQSTKAKLGTGGKSAARLWELPLKTLVSRFETVINGFADQSQRSKWEPYVTHYKLTISNNDDELVKLYLASRAAYNKESDSPDNLRQYAWVVYDCISRALQLADSKLVETFAAEGKKLLLQFERMPLRGSGLPVEFEEKVLSEVSEADAKDLITKWNAEELIVKVLPTALGKAERFLSGEGEATQWLKEGDIPKAIASYKEGLERDENNLEARIGLIELYLRNADVSSATSLLQEGLETADFVVRLTKVMRSVYYAWKSVWRSGNSSQLSGYYRQAGFYLMCAEKLGGILTDLACTNPSVTECLYRCAMAKRHSAGEALVAKHQAVIGVFEELGRRGIVWAVKHLTTTSCLGRLLLASGRIDEARPYVEKTLIANPDSSVAWTDYGRTFGKDSIDAAKCFCRAICCPSANETLALTAHELLGEYFEASGQMPRAMREYKICEGIREKNNWRQNSRLWVMLFRSLTGGPKMPEAVDSNEDIYAKLSASAGELISSGTIDVCGVVVSILRSRLRIWHESTRKGVPGAYAYVARGTVGDLSRGTPIKVSLNRFLDTETVASWSVRKDGALWDVYPTEVGVITKVDYNRGFWRIALGADVELSVGRDCVPSIANIPAGAFVQVRKVETAGEPEILEVAPIKDLQVLPSFVRRVEGTCKKMKQSRFGHIGDVFVPERLCKNVPSGTQMAVLAVEVENHRKKEKGWLAVAPAEDNLRRMDVACG